MKGSPLDPRAAQRHALAILADRPAGVPITDFAPPTLNALLRSGLASIYPTIHDGRRITKADRLYITNLGRKAIGA